MNQKIFIIIIIIIWVIKSMFKSVNYDGIHKFLHNMHQEFTYFNF